ncbi:MAG: prepilin-type N-terminal cleavage/methylation domain-containing protein [Bdellovibrionaceae bacterium]|nr:prepilin-type N-terminal cleavage/methylation domain-containing protein [Pseudobdellovibrionaceae bacterium]
MRRQSGFTLIEVLVAMMIILGAVVMVANAWSGNVARLEKARINNTTALLLQRKMTEIEIQYKEKSIDEIPEEESGDFGNAFPAYKWTMESKEFEMPDLSDMLISRDGGAQSELLTIVRTMTDVFNKNIKEVTVSVLYTSRRTKKTIKNSITTYFIDYSKDISLGAGTAAGGGGQ